MYQKFMFNLFFVILIVKSINSKPQENSFIQKFSENINHAAQVDKQSEIKTRSLPNEQILINEKGYFSDDMILFEIDKAIKFIKSVECVNDLNATLDGIRQGKSWAIAMYDASVKVPSGIEYGVTFQLGNFDQCMEIETSYDTDHVDIHPKYCLADVVVDGYNLHSIASRKYKPNNSTLIHWAICMPESCPSIDIATFLSKVTGHKNVTVSYDKCTVNEPIVLTKGDIIFGCVIISFVLMVLLSTIHHVYQMYRPDPLKGRNRGCFEMVMKSFSIVENLHKMGKTASDDLGLSCVNGIKALSMIFIVGSHALVFMVGGPVQNSSFFLNETLKWQNAFLLNSPLLVDSFLLLSGFLFARLLLLELNKRNGKINFGILYIFRYIRLTPAYLAMITLYITWMPKLGSGPLWNMRMLTEQKRCESSWWINLLYINNYVGSENLCMFQSWYLATDTQLFIVAPLVLYPLWKCRKLGAGFLGLVTLISVVIPFTWTYYKELDPTFIVFQDEAADLSVNEYFINTYVKTHMRATAYFFGIITGFLVHVMQENEYTISKITNILLWIASTIIGSASMFTITIFYDTTKTFSPLENALYAGLHRLGWSFATSWLILACVTGYAGPLKNILASRALAPLSRLTYCAYLTNGFIELYQASTLRAPKFMSVTNLLGEVLSHVCLTFIAATFLCLMFESPIHGIEKIFLRRDNQKQKKNQEQTPSTSEESA